MTVTCDSWEVEVQSLSYDEPLMNSNTLIHLLFARRVRVFLFFFIIIDSMGLLTLLNTRTSGDVVSIILAWHVKLKSFTIKILLIKLIIIFFFEWHVCMYCYYYCYFEFKLQSYDMVYKLFVCDGKYEYYMEG